MADKRISIIFSADPHGFDSLTTLQKQKRLPEGSLFYLVRMTGVAGYGGIALYPMARRPHTSCAVPVSPLFAKKNPPGSFFYAQTLTGSTPLLLYKNKRDYLKVVSSAWCG